MGVTYPAPLGGCKTERRKCTRPQNGQELSLSFDIASIEVYAVYSVASLDETVTHNGIYIAIGSTGNTWLHESCPGDGTVHIRVVSKSNHAASLGQCKSAVQLPRESQ